MRERVIEYLISEDYLDGDDSGDNQLVYEAMREYIICELYSETIMIEAIFDQMNQNELDKMRSGESNV